MNEMRQLACEGLIRRFAESHYYFPFMLKGSFLTRQYFPAHIERKPQDLDWVCLKPLVDRNFVEDHLNEWMNYLTTVDLNDGIRYEAFSKQHYWWELDYVMSDDFPTVTTSILAWVNGQKIDVDIDVSFNLKITDIQKSLTYCPFVGRSFKLSQTPSLATQIAWKLHQCIVNPRFKDIFDLTYVLKHLSFKNTYAQLSTIETLKAECERDGIILEDYLSPKKLILVDARRALSQRWKAEKSEFEFSKSKNIPENFEKFWNDFTQSLFDTGLLMLID